MNYEQFLESIGEILEVDPENLKPETDFRTAADYWSSLTGFALMIFIEGESGAGIGAEEFLELKTVEDLYNRTSLKKVERC